MVSRAKRIAVRLAFSIAFFLVLTEAVLRLFLPNAYPPYSRARAEANFSYENLSHPGQGLYVPFAGGSYRNRSGMKASMLYEDQKVGYTFTTNRHGFRTPDDLERGDADTVVLLIGDSLSFGAGVDDGENYPAQLQERLGPSWRIHNFATGGWGFGEYYMAWKEFAPLVRPDLVMINIFPQNDFSDLDATTWQGRSRGALPQHSITRTDVYVDDKGDLLSKNWSYRVPVLRESMVFVAVASKFALVKKLPGWIERKLGRSRREETALQLIAAIAREQPTLVVELPGYARFQENIGLSDRFRMDIGSLPNTEFLDLGPALASVADTIYLDGAHYTPEGNRIVAKVIAEKIGNGNLLP